MTRTKKAPAITDVQVTHELYGGRTRLSWSFDGARFHIWTDIELKPSGRWISGEVYKNPPIGLKSYEVGYFPTRTLSISAKPTRAMYEEAVRIAKAEGLVGKAIATARLKQNQEEAELAESVAKRRRQDAADELYHAAKPLADLVMYFTGNDDFSFAIPAGDLRKLAAAIKLAEGGKS